MADQTPDPGSEAPREAAWAISAAVAAFTLAGVAFEVGDHPARALAGASIVALAGTWLLRGPRGQVLAGTALLALGVTVIASGRSSNVAWFSVTMAASWCVVRGRRWDGLVYWVGALTLFAVEAVVFEPDPGWAAWSAGTTFAVLGALLVRREMRLSAELRAAQAALLDQARTDERDRIARELHDVIAHSLTVALLHVTSARVALEHAPDEAAGAMAEAERIGREALAEVRQTVGTLRRPWDPGWDRPQPTAADLPALVAGFRSAGADVELTVTGDREGVNDALGLTVYRITQEALTNAVKHAPGAPVCVRLTVAEGGIALTVVSAGPPTDGHGLGIGLGTGLGILGMRERAAAVGGSLEAGPGATGWLVSALLPSRS